MTQTYKISGMHCMSCVNKVSSALYSLNGVEKVDVSLEQHRAVLTLNSPVSPDSIDKVLASAGEYALIDVQDPGFVSEPVQSNGESFFPLILILLYLLGGVALASFVRDDYSLMTMMANFMGGFFIVFSFFKMLDINGFANAYAGYDVVARRWKGYGYVYPFIELALGTAYFIGFNHTITNLATLVVMSISSIGVIESVARKKRIQCACLGTVFNLPMTYVTILEDGLMVAMAAAMLTLPA